MASHAFRERTQQCEPGYEGVKNLAKLLSSRRSPLTRRPLQSIINWKKCLSAHPKRKQRYYNYEKHP